MAEGWNLLESPHCWSKHLENASCALRWQPYVAGSALAVGAFGSGSDLPAYAPPVASCREISRGSPGCISGGSSGGFSPRIGYLALGASYKISPLNTKREEVLAARRTASLTPHDNFRWELSAPFMPSSKMLRHFSRLPVPPSAFRRHS